MTRPGAASGPKPCWWVYIIEADDGSLYTGVSTDVQRRFGEHREGPRGARYFNGRVPVRILHTEPLPDRSSACRREAEIKRMSRAQKLGLIAGRHPQ